jgi:YbbR domain-containing protein
MNLRSLSEDWSLKLFSLGTAVLLFLFVSVENDTPVDVDFRIEYRTADDIMIVSDCPTVVNATLQGPWAKLRSFDMADLEPVVVDFTQSGPGRSRHAITTGSIRPPGGMRVVAVLPAEVEVSLDRRVERLVDVHADVAGSPAFGYEIGEVQLSPKKVRVVGPATKMPGLEYISTRALQVDGHEDSLSQDVDLRPPPPPMRLLDKRVQAFVVIHEEMAQRSFSGVPVVLKGAPRGTTVEPEAVTVVVQGPRRVLDGLDTDNLLAELDVYQDAANGAGRVDKTVSLRPELAERVQTVAPAPKVSVNVAGPRKMRRR